MSKIAVAGKGGVGKTTVAALLANFYAKNGQSVIAVDADPAACLGYALGLPEALVAKITPIIEMEQLIEERTGAKPGEFGSYFKLNPKVDDIPDRFSVSHNNIRLLQLGTINQGGSGCICPQSAMVKTLVTHLLLQRDEVLILDMDAGLEHLGRATAGAVDFFLVVVEPGRRSLETARQITSLANDIGIQKIFMVGNKVRNDDDRRFIESFSNGLPVLGFLSYSPQAIQADMNGSSVYEAVPQLASEVTEIVKKFHE